MDGLTDAVENLPERAGKEVWAAKDTRDGGDDGPNVAEERRVNEDRSLLIGSSRRV